MNPLSLVSAMTLAGFLGATQPTSVVHAATKLQSHHQTCAGLLLSISSKLSKKSPLDAALDWRLDLPADTPAHPLKGEYVGEEKGTAALWNQLGVKTRVSYLTPDQARAYQVKIEDGVFKDLEGHDICPGTECRGSITIDMNGHIFFSTEAESGKFHHSSFVAGGPVAFAGEAVFFYGRLSLLTKESGHYRPALKSYPFLIDLLARYGVEDYEVGVPVAPDNPQPGDLEYDVVNVSVENLARMFKTAPDVMNKMYVLKTRAFQDITAAVQRR